MDKKKFYKLEGIIKIKILVWELRSGDVFEVRGKVQFS